VLCCHIFTALFIINIKLKPIMPNPMNAINLGFLCAKTIAALRQVLDD
jgi:hypothetical protein